MGAPPIRRPGLLALVLVVIAGALVSASAAASAAPSPGRVGGLPVSHRAVCADAPVGFAHCDSEKVTDASGDPLVTPNPSGYGPADLQSAYNLTNQAASAGATQTIAIVDAYDDPNAEADLGVYRSQYGLPPCTTANGCFRKVNQNGGTTYPATDAGWAQEISLDLDMASATCPNCHILLVEANTNSFNNLAAAVDRAATLGATQISNSYGGNEFPFETTAESHYNHPGVAVTVSSGDDGYGVEFPASSRYVTAVGGTTLVRDASARGWSETAWSGAGSGCSAYEPKPAWQTDSACSNRSVADVSAVADPATGVAVYDSLDYNGSSGWMVFGGTSASAPIVAAFDALLGAGAASPSYPYGHAGSYYDVTAGSNDGAPGSIGGCGTYLCTAGPGYDGPTGLGTPKGSGGTPSNQPPTAVLSVTPNPATTGQVVTFSAAGSGDVDGSIAKYEWDLDGDGSFECDTGTTASTTATYGSAQSLTVLLRVTDDDGERKTASSVLTVNAPENQPPVASFTFAPAQPQTGEVVSFDGSASQDPGGTIAAYSWNFGDGGTATGISPTHTYLAQGSYTVTLTVSDGQGGTGSTPKTVPVVAPSRATPAASVSPSAPPTASADRVRPVVGVLHLSAATFTAAPHGPSALAARAVGTRLVYRLSEAAVTTFRVERAVTGRRVGGRCVRVSRANRFAPRCTRRVLFRGAFVRAGRAGANTLRFTGRLSPGGRLAPGVYWLVARAADRAGNRSLIRRTRFRIVR